MRSIADVLAYVRQLAATTPPDRVILVPKVYSTRLVEHRYPTRAELDQAAPRHVAITDNGYAASLNSLGARQNRHHARHAAAGQRTHRERRRGRTDGPDPRRAAAAHGTAAIAAAHPRRHRLGDQGNAEGVQRGRPDEHDRSQSGAGRISRLPGASRAQRADRSHGGDVPHERSGHARQRAAGRRAHSVRHGLGDEWLRVGPLKVVVDGGILIGTAYLREPYGDHTEIYGYEDRNLSRCAVGAARESH